MTLTVDRNLKPLVQSIDIGVTVDVINKSGSWYAYKDQKIGQGKENAKVFLKENPEISREIKDRILEIKELNPEKLDEISISNAD